LSIIEEEYFGCITTDNLEQFIGRRWDEESRKYRNVIKRNKYCRVRSFQKDETYPKYKPARAINSRTDQFKVRTGPIFKLIEKELFALPWFIKHTPCDERAEEIKRELFQEGATIIGTDYTAYESLFRLRFMQMCEFKLYKYMTQHLEDQEWYNIVSRVLGGTNSCYFPGKFIMNVQATRMSGEMCTSLGNSFSNLMAMLFVAKQKGYLDSIKGRVEGDDGIFTFYGPSPTPEDFAKLGMIIKIDKYESLTEGSFCGIIADEKEMINVTDPINTMLDFGWTSRQYVDATIKKKKQLLRSKALSLAYQYPGCPILGSLARYGLRITEGSRFYTGDMCEYEKDQFYALRRKFNNRIPQREVGHMTRLLVEKRYGITVEDQIRIETYLDSKNDLSPLDLDAILSNCPYDSLHYYDRYALTFSIKHTQSFMDCPFLDNYCIEKLKHCGFDKYEYCTENEYDEETTSCTKAWWKPKIKERENSDCSATKENATKEKS